MKEEGKEERSILGETESLCTKCLVCCEEYCTVNGELSLIITTESAQYEVAK